MDAISFLILVGICWISLIAITNNKWIKLKNPEIGLGYALYRTTKFNTFLDKIAGISRRLWSYLFDIGVLVCLGILIAAILFISINIIGYGELLVEKAGLVASTSTNQPNPVPIVPIIPGISVSFTSLPYILIAIALSAALHESAHGIAARAEKIEVKSAGIMFLLLFFGAFVEPDEESLSKSNYRKQMRVFAAGAFVNLLLVLLLIPLFIPPVFNTALSPFYNPSSSGALIVDVCTGIPNCTADKSGIHPGTVIVEAIFANGTAVPITSSYDFQIFSNQTYVNESVQLKVKGSDTLLNVTTISINNSTRGYIGVIAYDYHEPLISFFNSLWPYYIINCILFTVLISLSLALFNLLPFPPLDGDKFISALLKSKLSTNNARLALKWIRITTGLVLLFNILLSLLISGIKPI